MRSGKPVALLYVEDEPQARELVTKLLRHKFPHLQLFIAVDGEEGLSLFREHHPQIVLTDLVMPGLDGMEMSRLIRKLDSGVYVIVLTAHNEPTSIDPDSDNLFNVRLSKPTVFSKVVDAVANALEQVSGKQLPA